VYYLELTSSIVHPPSTPAALADHNACCRIFFSESELSVNEYYKKVSNGAISMTGAVTGPYACLSTFHTMPTMRAGAQAEPNCRTMAQHAVEAMNGDRSSGSLSRYDNNGDGQMVSEGLQLTAGADAIYSRWTVFIAHHAAYMLLWSVSVRDKLVYMLTHYALLAAIEWRERAEPLSPAIVTQLNGQPSHHTGITVCYYMRVHLSWTVLDSDSHLHQQVVITTPDLLLPLLPLPDRVRCSALISIHIQDAVAHCARWTWCGDPLWDLPRTRTSGA